MALFYRPRFWVRNDVATSAVSGAEAMPMKAEYGERIVCEAAHVCGFFRNRIEEGVKIQPDDLTILAATSAETGYLCEECHSAIARLQSDRWEVRTDRGWVF
jgi:hypothetical protein